MSAGSPVQDHTIALNGLRFHYRAWGRDESPPVLLLHFFTWHARTWDTIAHGLSDSYRVLTLDQRGHGESDWATAYGSERGMEDLGAFAQALHLERFSLVGFSMGGHAALRYAARHPDKVERLVLGETIPGQRNPARAYLAAWLGLPDAFADPDDAVLGVRPLIPRAGAAELRHWVVNNLVQRADRRWTWRYDAAFRGPDGARTRAGLGTPVLELLPQITCPTLIMRGGESEMFERDQGDEMAGSLPRGRLLNLSNAGHWTPLDDPAGVLGALRDFLADA